MDPLSAASLVGTCLGVADIMVRLGGGLRDLVRQFGGALAHAEEMARHADTIDFVIREICSSLNDSSNLFPPAFETHLRESATAIGFIVGQIQNYTRSVKAETERSPSRGKLHHLWHGDEVLRWKNSLDDQIHALTLLLYVARFRSIDEKTLALKQESNRRILEEASSLSARLGNSSRVLSSGQPCTANIQSFIFDDLLFETKVYRRACKSALTQAVTQNDEDISVSSNNAIASQSGDIRPAPSADAGVANAGESAATRAHTHPTVSTCNSLQLIAVTQPPTLKSASSTTSPGEVTGESFTTRATDSTLATTMSSTSQIKDSSDETTSTSGRILAISVVRVVVDKVGRSHVNLPISPGSDHFLLVEAAITNVRDRILLDGGIPPAIYRGSRVCCTIETSGKAVHTFEFTAKFLDAALEKIEAGHYSNLQILALFSAPTQKDGHLQVATAQRTAPRGEEDEPSIRDGKKPALPIRAPHFVFGQEDALPLFQQIFATRGGFGHIFQVRVDPEYLGLPSGDARDQCAGYYAMKMLHVDKKQFQNEREAHGRCSQTKHSHVVPLLASFEQRTQDGRVLYHLLFPWAEGNLREFWKRQHKPLEPRLISSARLDTALWMMQQCAGLASGLEAIHKVLNESRAERDTVSPWAHERLFGRHGDIKPENILWFSDRSRDTLVISDFGASRFHRAAVLDDRAPFTPTYRPPECEVKGAPRSRAFDIWSLGCMYLEFLTWLLHGSKGIEIFQLNRVLHVKDGAFFVSDKEPGGEGFVINPSVSRQIKVLLAMALRCEPPLDKSLASFVDLISRCLEIREEQRPPTEALAIQLQDLYAGLDQAVRFQRSLALVVTGLVRHRSRKGVSHCLGAKGDRMTVGQRVLLAELHMNTLIGLPTRGDIKQALRNLSKGAGGLNETCRLVMKKVEGQRYGNHELAKKIVGNGLWSLNMENPDGEPVDDAASPPPGMYHAPPNMLALSPPFYGYSTAPFEGPAATSPLGYYNTSSSNCPVSFGDSTQHAGDNTALPLPELLPFNDNGSSNLEHYLHPGGYSTYSEDQEAQLITDFENAHAVLHMCHEETQQSEGDVAVMPYYGLPLYSGDSSPSFSSATSFPTSTLASSLDGSTYCDPLLLPGDDIESMTTDRTNSWDSTSGTGCFSDTGRFGPTSNHRSNSFPSRDMLPMFAVDQPRRSSTLPASPTSGMDRDIYGYVLDVPSLPLVDAALQQDQRRYHVKYNIYSSDQAKLHAKQALQKKESRAREGPPDSCISCIHCKRRFTRKDNKNTHEVQCGEEKTK